MIEKAEIRGVWLQGKECQRELASHQEWGKVKEGFLHGFQRDHRPGDTLNLDFSPSELWDSKFLLF